MRLNRRRALGLRSPVVPVPREHPFGTLKAWMGSTHFLTRTLPRVRTEMSLHVLVYNLKRMLQIFGTQMVVAFMKA